MSRLLAAMAGASASLAATAGLEQHPPGGRQRWARRNYADREVSLLGGLTTVTGVAAASALTGGRPGRAAAVAISAAGAAGMVDDLTESSEDRRIKGLRGHLGALARGKVTTGTMKIAGLGAGGLLAVAMLPPNERRATSRAGGLIDLMIGTALVAGSANLLNLFDLRPGRALKITALGGGALAAAGAGHPQLPAAAAGAALAALRDDLGERTMLGDTGANALGAALGTALATVPSRTARSIALSGIVGLTLLSERVSFSEVIDDTPVLRELDAWGRR